VIDSTPEALLQPINLHENLVEMQTPMLETPHDLEPVSPDLSREDHPGPVPPEPHRFMRDVDPALMQQILDIPQ
jgi:hypothetical protein